MKSIEQLKKQSAGQMAGFSQKYHVRRMGIFGSYARGEAVNGSDLDIMVSFSKPIGLDFVQLAEELEGLLGLKVDLVSDNALKPGMRKSIENELIYV